MNAEAASSRIVRSVSVAIHRPLDGALLVVQRPPDDEDLPDAWGLPAASLRSTESWEDAVRRAARDKLGVEVDPVEVLGEGHTQRAHYTLHMRLYAARITAGEPAVPQPHPDVTQYQAWRWGGAGDVRAAAEAGSLCSRLYLQSAGLP
jgi:ADP-ribose pyrophosphatase YjhB (NUDIX family)